NNNTIEGCKCDTVHRHWAVRRPVTKPCRGVILPDGSSRNLHQRHSSWEILRMTGSCPGWWRRWVTLGLVFLLPAILAVLPALVAAQDTQEAEARLSSARRLCQEKKYLAALDELKPLTTDASCPPLVSFYLGLAERGLGVQELSTGQGKPT